MKKSSSILIRVQEKLKKAAAEKAAANKTTLTNIITKHLKNYIND